MQHSLPISRKWQSLRRALIVGWLSLFGFGLFAQVATRYNWAQTSGTYTAVGASGANALFPDNWDDDTTAVAIPFPFSYDGTPYSTMKVSSNGFVVFGATLGDNNSDGAFVSGTEPEGLYLGGISQNNGVAVFNADLDERTYSTMTARRTSGSNILTNASSTTNLRVGMRLSGTGIDGDAVITAISGTNITLSEPASSGSSTTTTLTPRGNVVAVTTGSSPNRVLVIQWTRVARFSYTTADDISVQLRLSEGGGNAANQTVQVVFGTCATSATENNDSPQVGIRTTTSDFNARTQTASSDWTVTSAATNNTDRSRFRDNRLPSSGLTWTWSPVYCTGTPTAGTIAGTSPLCSGTSTALNVSGQSTTGYGLSTAWSWGTVSGGPYPNSAGTGTSINSGALTSTRYYRATTTCSNGGASASTPEFAVVVNSAPTAANAGSNQSVCITTTSMTLAGNAPSSGTGAWSVVTAPGGGSTNISQFGGGQTNPTATFTPSPLVAGTYTLRWTISNAPCAASTDEMDIAIRGLATTNAGVDQTVCSSSATFAATAATPGTGAWALISGAGSVTTPSSATSGITALGVGANTFQWTITNSPCPSTNDQVVITRDPAPTTSAAGPDQTHCITTTSMTLAANTPSVGTGAWSVVTAPGGGSTNISQFGGDQANPAATFTPSPLVAGTYTLRWSISNGVCAASTDNVDIIVRSLSVASNAGPDQTVCASTATLAGNSPSPGTGQWTLVSGSGSVTNSTSATSGVTGLGVGANTFQWTITNSPCPSTIDQVVITRDATPTAANAGADQSLCLSAVSMNMAANNPSVGTGSWTAIAGPNTSLGQLSNVSANNATFTPTTTGTYTLTWTTANGVCANSNDNVVITVLPFAQPVAQTFDANGSFVVPAGVTQITVQAWGGGGAGGGTDNTGVGSRGGAGGGGGAYVTKTLTVTPGSTLNVLVGAQVSGTTAGNGSNGNPSTITGFEAQVFAAGGSGGGAYISSAPTGGAGGTLAASQGDSEIAGENGGNGGSNSGAGGDGANGGGAGGAAVTSGQVNGNGGSAPGGGGSGGRSSLFSSDRAGGAGAAGRVIITTVAPIPAVSATASTICEGSSTTLTASGGGSYLWSPGGATTNSIVVSPGSTTTYSVTVTNTCPAFLTQEVAVVPQPNAGADNSLTICSIDAAVNIGTLLGAHDAGSWSGPSTVVADMYDPATMTQGNYVYTVTAAPCPNATATIAVTENTATPRYADVDGDGFGDASDMVLSCSPIAGRVSDNTDCNDAMVMYTDGDGDGFGAGSPVACGGIADNSDCNDAQLQYNDGDGDGFGTGAPVACGVANNSDCNDAQLQYADTDGDGFGAGSPVACGVVNNTDDCPTVVGLIGSNCDATPGPGFTLGQLNGSCNCVAIACTQNVVLELRSDVNSDEIGWEILDQNTNLVICSDGAPVDPYPGGITTPITSSCCLPVGCYRLRVTDAGGDGFVSGGITGGYQLRESGANGRRIIDNFANFTGGSQSAVANTYDNGAFCVPIGNDRPIFTSCDKLDWVNDRFIVATENTAVSDEQGVTNTTSGYEFWFFDPNGSYSFRRFRSHATSDGTGSGALRACHFRINGWSNTIATPHLPANVLLNVRIRGRVAGVNQPFGPACLFKIDPVRASCPLVKLQDNPGNTADYSCGVSRVFGGVNSASNKLVANPPQFTPAIVASNLRYQFRFRLPGEYPNPGSCIVRPIQTSPTIYLNWTSGDKLKCNTQYQVDVRVSKDGGATWCVADGEPTCSATPTLWGKVCNVNITTSMFCPGGAQDGGSNLAAAGEGIFSMYPNPNNGDQLFMSLNAVEKGVSTVTVDIYDMTGKRVMARTMAVQDGSMKSTMELNGDLRSGMYIVNVTAGVKTMTERLVIQR